MKEVIVLCYSSLVGVVGGGKSAGSVCVSGGGGGGGGGAVTVWGMGVWDQWLDMTGALLCQSIHFFLWKSKKY